MAVLDVPERDDVEVAAVLVPATTRREIRDAVVVGGLDSAVSLAPAVLEARRLPAMALDSARGTFEATAAPFAGFARPSLLSAPREEVGMPEDRVLLALVRSPKAVLLRVPNVLPAAVVATALPATVALDVSLSLALVTLVAAVVVADGAVAPEAPSRVIVFLVRIGGRLAFCVRKKGEMTGRTKVSARRKTRISLASRTYAGHLVYNIDSLSSLVSYVDSPSTRLR